MYKMQQSHVHYDLRKHFFTNKVISIWNSLPNNIVTSASITSFKNRLGKFWANQEVKFDWEANITGTGSHSMSLYRCDIEA
jgi:hypothetical protein